MSAEKEREQKTREVILSLEISDKDHRHSFKEIASLAHVPYTTADAMCRRMKGFVREDGAKFVGGQYGEYRWRAKEASGA
ncbi:MAG TPA: hypothetical protein VHV10_16570 [Ktedonobacteraceae bacterium]|nr:hypothetical protein [Ktedonobacteraceae bacterium]